MLCMEELVFRLMSLSGQNGYCYSYHLVGSKHVQRTRNNSWQHNSGFLQPEGTIRSVSIPFPSVFIYRNHILQSGVSYLQCTSCTYCQRLINSLFVQYTVISAANQFEKSEHTDNFLPPVFMETNVALLLYLNKTKQWEQWQSCTVNESFCRCAK